LPAGKCYYAYGKFLWFEHSLIRLQDNTLCCITKRVDRAKNGKLHMEEMCQLSERLTEDKYKGRYKQLAKLLMKYSSSPLLDVANFYELVLFSFFYKK
jgi:serine/threonine-protein kinase HipA